MSGAGSMFEWLTIQRDDAAAVTLLTLTRSSTTATATTLGVHGFTSNDYVTIAGASPSGYNGIVKVTVTSTSVFTYTVSSSLASSATGAITATYKSNAQGEARRDPWRDLAIVSAELLPLRAMERIQLRAIQSDTMYRFRVRARTDLTPKQRALWTPRWPPGQAQHTLEINGVLPDENGLQYAQLECSESPVPA